MSIMHTLRRVLGYWLPLLILLTGLELFAYWAVQQNYRVSLNDPQIQMAENAAAAIASGKQIDRVVPIERVDMAQSLSPWLAVYTNAGVPILSSGELEGASPQLPLGVFDVRTWHTYAEFGLPLSVPADETRFTWQPRPNVRQAIVLVHFSSQNGIGFIAAGRNMREVENREAVLTRGAALLWGGTALGTFMALTLVLAFGLL